MKDPLAQLLATRYPLSSKIVEVGVGARTQTAEDLRRSLPRTDIRVTDLGGAILFKSFRERIRAHRDDVHSPRLGIYEDADILYSVRPPPDMVPALERLADQVGAELVVAPLSDDRGLVSEPPWRPLQWNGRVLAWVRPRRPNHPPTLPRE